MVLVLNNAECVVVLKLVMSCENFKANNCARIRCDFK